MRFPLFSKFDGHNIVRIDTLSNLSFRGDGFLARICGRRSFSALLLRGYGFARLLRGARVNRRENISLKLRIYSRMFRIPARRPGVFNLTPASETQNRLEAKRQIFSTRPLRFPATEFILRC